MLLDHTFEFAELSTLSALKGSSIFSLVAASGPEESHFGTKHQRLP